MTETLTRDELDTLAVWEHEAQRELAKQKDPHEMLINGHVVAYYAGIVLKLIARLKNAEQAQP